MEAKRRRGTAAAGLRSCTESARSQRARRGDTKVLRRRACPPPEEQHISALMRKHAIASKC